MSNKLHFGDFLLWCVLALPLLACADSSSDMAAGGAGVSSVSAEASSDSGSPAAAGSFEEGVHYIELFEPVPSVSAPADKIEVVEMFWYGCPHCFHLEPALTKWEKNIASDVQVTTVPATLNPSWTLHAKVFYAAEAMGVSGKVHEALFQAIHEQGRRLYSEGAILRFIASLGIDEARFRSAMNSLAVTTKVNRAKQLGQLYGATGVPALIVGGQYRVLSNAVKSHEEIFAIVDYLIGKVRSAR